VQPPLSIRVETEAVLKFPAQPGIDGFRCRSVWQPVHQRTDQAIVFVSGFGEAGDTKGIPCSTQEDEHSSPTPASQ